METLPWLRPVGPRWSRAGRLWTSSGESIQPVRSWREISNQPNQTSQPRGTPQTIPTKRPHPLPVAWGRSAGLLRHSAVATAAKDLWRVLAGTAILPSRRRSWNWLFRGHRRCRCRRPARYGGAPRAAAGERPSVQTCKKERLPSYKTLRRSRYAAGSALPPEGARVPGSRSVGGP